MSEPEIIEKRLAELLASAQRHYGLSPEGLALDLVEHRRTHYGEDGDPLWPRLRKLIVERHLPAGYYEDRRHKGDLLASENLLRIHATLSAWAALPEEERLVGARKLHGELREILQEWGSAPAPPGPPRDAACGGYFPHDGQS